NSKINFTKSVYMPLSTAPLLFPTWVSMLGLRIHHPSIPIRVLGYDLVLSSDGVDEDWNALYSRLETVSEDILSRQLSLQGCSLLVNSKLLSRLWYKCRLSSPTTSQLTRFTGLAWKTVWNDHTALAPAINIGRCPRS